MIATGFSVLIRLELSAPGTQFLQGDHQLYNVIITAHGLLMRAPSHFIMLQRKSGHFSFVLQDLISRPISWLKNAPIGVSSASIDARDIEYITRVTASSYANNCETGVAGDQRTSAVGLPSLNWRLRVSINVDDKKLDTLRPDKKQPRILSRICRYVFGIAE